MVVSDVQKRPGQKELWYIHPFVIPQEYTPGVVSSPPQDTHTHTHAPGCECAYPRHAADPFHTFLPSRAGEASTPASVISTQTFWAPTQTTADQERSPPLSEPLSAHEADLHTISLGQTGAEASCGEEFAQMWGGGGVARKRREKKKKGFHRVFHGNEKVTSDLLRARHWLRALPQPLLHTPAASWGGSGVGGGRHRSI